MLGYPFGGVCTQIAHITESDNSKPGIIGSCKKGSGEFEYAFCAGVITRLAVVKIVHQDDPAAFFSDL